LRSSPKEQRVLAKLFSFRGRLTRLEFLGWSFAAVFIFTIGAVLIMTLGVIDGRMNAAVTGIIVVLAVLIAAVWSGLALQVKRVRDMGFSPLLVIGGLFAFEFIDTLVLRHFVHLSFFPLSLHSAVGELAQLAFIGVLLFWPSASGDSRLYDEPDDVAPVAAQASTPRPSMAPQTMAGPSLAQPGGARREFGLRTR
jgi:uncharacterized membrane protein YhaH (DUF805 family)